MKVYRSHLMICGGTGCHASGSIAVKEALERELQKHNLTEEIKIVETGCNGFCAMGPIMVVQPDGVMYVLIKPEDVEELVSEHLVKGRILKRLIYKEPTTKEEIPTMQEIPFFAHQELRVLRNRGLIDPEKIDEYIARDGYLGMGKALTEMTPEQIVAEVKKSGLRGRGGAGFPTGTKWDFASRSQSDIKFVLCNADEGDPGAFMDRSVLEADPHAVIEGMVVAAKAIGSHQGYIYCRAEYPLAISRMNLAISQAREYGLLGKDILGTGFDFDLEIYQGAGAFVCGEETALMRSIEGHRGMPRPRPPFPASQGLWEKPTILNNVETFANIGQIMLRGGDWYASIGTEGSKGTKVFALTGDVNNIGLVEVPMGTSIGTIIYDIGGGIQDGKKYKAAQLGGPSGGCIPAQHLNTPTDYEAIAKVGAIMGSGGLIVMDEESCMVDVARFFMDFCQDESCGKCVPCREGTKRMLEILTNITEGKGKDGDIELLEEMAANIKDSSLCGLGQTAPNPVLSTIRYFRHEYESHIYDKKCLSAVCSALFASPCQHMCPIEMDVPKYIALIKADRLDDAYKMLLKTNPFPSVCGRVCNQACTTRCRRGQTDEPIAIAALKRYITDNGRRLVVKKVPHDRKEKVAIIGAGPAGLTAALDLTKRGYAVTVFEELPEPGGMLRYGIPAYRLPRETLKEEIDHILSHGIDLKLNARIGKDISFEQLKKDYDIVFMAVGAHKSYTLGVEGENLKGVYGGVEFLRDVNLGKKVDVGKKVAVIGGGNSAVDAARTALRLGATDVTIYYRRLKEDMPAQEEEIDAALDEGIKLELFTAPGKLSGKGGKVEKMEVVRMKAGDFDSSGRKRPVPREDGNFTVDVDSVIYAIGQQPDLSFLPKDKGDIEVAKGDTFKAAGRFKTRMKAEGFFAGGDAMSGAAFVVTAVDAGHKAAQEIDEYIRTKNNEPAWIEPEMEKIDIPSDVDEEIIETPRFAQEHLKIKDLAGSFEEVDKGLSRKNAKLEANRCLRCDLSTTD
jgi:NADH-quinone oxidoreductase subunit F